MTFMPCNKTIIPAFYRADLLAFDSIHQSSTTPKTAATKFTDQYSKGVDTTAALVGRGCGVDVDGRVVVVRGAADLVLETVPLKIGLKVVADTLEVELRMATLEVVVNEELVLVDVELDVGKVVESGNVILVVELCRTGRGSCLTGEVVDSCTGTLELREGPAELPGTGCTGAPGMYRILSGFSPVIESEPHFGRRSQAPEKLPPGEDAQFH